jgi:YjbR protein
MNVVVSSWTMTEYAEVPETVVGQVRAACAHLPEAYEEQAFAGVRWRIRGRTLAHVVTIDDGRDVVTVLWFHAASEELDALLGIGDPFSPGWDDGLVTMALRDDGTTDWGEVKELLTESYCLLAPKKLIARLGSLRPGD